MREQTNRLQGNTVFVKEGEHIERALKRFKKKVQDSGILQELREREFYEKPTTAKKRAKSAAKNRWKKYLESQQLPVKNY
jgi:small subunit ribosomal protein S21